MSVHPTSPAATGDRGGSFEQQVAACHLAFLLSRGVPPFLQGTTVEEVHLQAGHLGWKTDDLVLVGTGPLRRQVALQVKSAFTFSADNKECQEVFSAACSDFNNAALFVRPRDGIAVICGPLPVATQRRLRIALDAARAALNPADWLNRLTLPGYHEHGAALAADALRALLTQANGTAVTDQQLWEFAKVFDFQCLDLLTPSSVTEASVRSLLTFTASAGPLPPAEAAERTWNELLALVGTGEPTAASYDYAKLPDSLRQRHDKAPSVTGTTAKAITDHSKIVERGVRTTIGGKLTLARTELVATIQAAWESHRILCISGPAGSGKSGVTKAVFELMKAEGLAMAFRAESFAEPHLNDVFAPHGFTAESFRALAALHPRKWIWVESMERLLEKSERHAFLDLLALVADDPSLRLILTCRDYQVEAIKSAMFGASGLPCVHLAVPSLSDAELVEAERQMPALAVPFSVPRLRELLRNLFMLEKAAALDWSAEATLPQNEREFRAKVWRETIRREDQPAGGMPQKRSNAFIEIAVRRAQKLEAFVDCADLDAEVLQQLRQDGLTMCAANDDAWVATAHDVLEDWAVLEWLSQQWRRQQGDVPKFLPRIGTFPALRRAYRRWLTEWLEAEPAVADQFVLGVLASTADRHWRDDTLAATLLSGTVDSFIRRNEAVIVANNLALLRQCIHLLRVACKGTPAWLGRRQATGAGPLVPQGPAWGAIIDVVHRNIAAFSADDKPLLAGLLGDWARSATEQNPYPAGADSAAKIAQSFLPSDEDYGFRSDELNQNFAAILLRVPKSLEADLTARIRASVKEDRWDRWRPGVAGLALSYFKAAALARDCPDLVIEVLEAYVGLNPEVEETPESYRRPEIAEGFGLPSRLQFDEHQDSAYHGPFCNLLRYHPAKGIDVLVRLMNKCCAAYGDPAHLPHFLEKPVQVTLELPDGTKVLQWANSRLWLMFRGTSVAPAVLCSALMALEAWLFDLAESKPAELEATLLDLLRRSNNVGVTGVVASVAQAYPRPAGKAGLALLSCPPLFDLDLGRRVSESGRTGGLLALPPIDAEHAIFDHERGAARAREHRQEDLEAYAVRLQFGPLKADVQRMLDTYRAALPPVTEQDEETVLWRLRLHRIDLRNFEVAQTLEDGRQLIQSTPPASDIQELIGKRQPALARHNGMMSLWLWSTQCWERKKDSSDPKEWPARLAEARRLSTADGASSRLDERLENSAIPQVAAICVRDHWDEMSDEDQAWCRECVCAAAVQEADLRAEHGMILRGTLDLNRAAAEALPLLLGKTLTPEERADVLECVAIALTHAQDPVRAAAALGIGRRVWDLDPALAWSCVGALVKEFDFVKAKRKEQDGVPFPDRVPWEQIEQLAADEVRPGLIARELVSREKLLGLALGDGSGHKVLPLLLGILVLAPPTDPLAVEFFALVAKTLAAAWAHEAAKGKRDSHSKFDDDEEGLDLEKEAMLSRHLAQFLLDLPPEQAVKTAAPVLAAAMLHPERGAAFLGHLIDAQDQRQNSPAFWTLWQSLADGLMVTVSAKKPTPAQQRGIPKLVEKLFLGVHWNPDTRDWLPLEGETGRLKELFAAFGAHPLVVESYLVCLRRPGANRLLPQAFLALAQKVSTKPAAQVLSSRSVACLEEILGRFIYSDPTALKVTPEMRAAVLALLDACIEAGSSECYRQRDDFLTPAVPSV